MLDDRFRLIILSRHREQTIADQSLTLFPYATVTVEESEVDAYAKVVDRARILPHPEFETMADLRNWLLGQWGDEEFQVHVHDDLVSFRCLVGWRARRYSDPRMAAQLIERTAICARDAGCGLFGFGNHPGGTPHYNKMKPFLLSGYVRNIIGFVRGHELRWDPEMMGHYDVDLGLQSLLKHRIIWRDERWTFDDAPLAAAAGGFSGVRTQAGIEQGRRKMVAKWGRYVRWDQRRDRRRKDGRPSRTEATVLRVPRRDPRVR